MELYVDTADVEAVREYAAMGVVDGVTTNPSIVADDGRPYRGGRRRRRPGTRRPRLRTGRRRDRRRHGRGGEGVPGVGRRGSGEDTGDAGRVRGAPPVAREAGVPAGITVVFSVEQAMLAAKNDATFVAPYVGRIEDAGDDGVGTVERIQAVFDAYGFSTDVPRRASGRSETGDGVLCRRRGLDNDGARRPVGARLDAGDRREPRGLRRGLGRARVAPRGSTEGRD